MNLLTIYEGRLVTREDKTDESIKHRIELIKASGGEYTMQDLDGASPALGIQLQGDAVELTYSWSRYLAQTKRG